MGRRPNAFKKLEGANPALEGNKTQLELQKKPTSGGNTHQLEMQNTPTLEGNTPNFEIQANSNSLSSSRKRAKNQSAIVRRSGRLQSSFWPTLTINSEPVIEAIISESENEDGLQVYQEEDFIEPTTARKTTLEERIDAVLEAQKVDRETLKSPNGPEISLPSQGPSRPNLYYRSLYFESQKKIQSLTEENHQLSKKFEYALAKLEVYEKGPPLSETLMLMISNMAKVTEAAIKLTAQAIANAVVPSSNGVVAPNRKRQKGIGKEN